MLENDFSYLQTLLVTGGYIGDNWISAASLPSPGSRLSGVTLGDSLFVFGKIYNFTLHLTRGLISQEDITMKDHGFSLTTFRQATPGDLQEL